MEYKTILVLICLAFAIYTLILGIYLHRIEESSDPDSDKIKKVSSASVGMIVAGTLVIAIIVFYYMYKFYKKHYPTTGGSSAAPSTSPQQIQMVAIPVAAASQAAPAIQPVAAGH
jgi:glucose uptake protein GlcU